MAEIQIRFVGVAIPETFGLEPNKNDETKMPSVVGKIRSVEGPNVGEEVWFRGHLQGGAAEITMKQLRALGWTCNDITVLTGLGSTKADVTGADEEYQGKVYRRYNVWALRERPSLRPEDQKLFSAKFRELAAGLRDKDGKSLVVAVTDANRAPATLPAAKESAPAAAAAVAKATSSDDLFR